MKKGSSFIIIVIGICLLIASIVIMDSAENSETIQLSRDHKPDLEDEKARIIQSNGRVDRYIGK